MEAATLWQPGHTVKLYLFGAASLSVPFVAGITIPLLSSSTTAHVLALSARTVVLLAACMLFYLLTAQSVQLRRNAFGRYLLDFRALYASAAAALLLDVIAATVAVGRVSAGRTPEELMQSQLLLVLTSVSQVGYAVFCACALAATAQVLQPRHWTLDASRGAQLT